MSIFFKLYEHLIEKWIKYYNLSLCSKFLSSYVQISFVLTHDSTFEAYGDNCSIPQVVKMHEKKLSIQYLTTVVTSTTRHIQTGSLNVMEEE